MSKTLSLLAFHVFLLVLASTCFTVVTGFRDGHYQWEYFRYASGNGWGLPYLSTYSLEVVLTYLAAYVVGVTAFSLAYRAGSRVTGMLGMLLCVIGCASFALEFSHWLVDHHRSWIASAPVALLVLTPAAGLELLWRRKNWKNLPVHTNPPDFGH